MDRRELIMRTQATIKQSDQRPGGELIGTIRRFGEYGVAYEVIGLGEEGQVLVRVVESGETLGYPAANVRTDPQA